MSSHLGSWTDSHEDPTVTCVLSDYLATTAQGRRGSTRNHSAKDLCTNITKGKKATMWIEREEQCLSDSHRIRGYLAPGPGRVPFSSVAPLLNRLIQYITAIHPSDLLFFPSRSVRAGTIHNRRLRRVIPIRATSYQAIGFILDDKYIFWLVHITEKVCR
jgi:hypothetical protein